MQQTTQNRLTVANVHMDNDSSGSDDNGCSIQRVLTEDNIPGASLSGRNPCSLIIPELKRLLQCHNASLRGKKAELVAR